jgi:hypothetical protein
MPKCRGKDGIFLLKGADARGVGRLWRVGHLVLVTCGVCAGLRRYCVPVCSPLYQWGADPTRTRLSGSLALAQNIQEGCPGLNFDIPGN